MNLRMISYAAVCVAGLIGFAVRKRRTRKTFEPLLRRAFIRMCNEYSAYPVDTLTLAGVQERLRDVRYMRHLLWVITDEECRRHMDQSLCKVEGLCVFAIKLAEGAIAKRSVKEIIRAA